jgi:hypothetical protein
MLPLKRPTRAAIVLSSFSISKLRTHFNSTVGHNSIPNQVSTTTEQLFGGHSSLKMSISQDSVLK